MNIKNSSNHEDYGQKGILTASTIVDFCPIIQKSEAFISAYVNKTPITQVGALNGTPSFAAAMTLPAFSGAIAGGFNAENSIKASKRAKTTLAKAVHGLDGARHIVDITLAAANTTAAGFSLATINSSACSAVVNGLSCLKIVASSIGSIFVSLFTIPKCIIANKSILVKNILKKEGINGLKNLYKRDPAALEVALPKLFKKLKEGVGITNLMVNSALKELNKNITINIAQAVIGLASLALGILAVIFTAGIAFVAIVITGFVLNLVIGSFDIVALIDMLKNTYKLTPKDTIIKTIAIAASVTSIVISAIFAPTIGVRIAGIVSGAFLTTIPLTSLIATAQNSSKTAK